MAFTGTATAARSHLPSYHVHTSSLRCLAQAQQRKRNETNQDDSVPGRARQGFTAVPPLISARSRALFRCRMYKAEDTTGTQRERSCPCPTAHVVGASSPSRSIGRRGSRRYIYTYRSARGLVPFHFTSWRHRRRRSWSWSWSRRRAA